MRLKLTILLLSVLFSNQPAWSAVQNGVITRVEGAPTLLTKPGSSVEGPKPRALYRGKYYTFVEAKVGMPVKSGSFVRTGPDDRLRIIYENGDQIFVGPGTTYRIYERKVSKSRTNSDIEMEYGNLRSVVSKKGKKRKLRIRTKSATLGIRGTDFSVVDGGKVRGTELAVLRGKVRLKPVKKGSKAVDLVKGQSGVTQATKKTAQVQKTTQYDLLEIHQFSKMKRNDDAPKEVADLENKASESTLSDIKSDDPKLYNELTQGGKKKNVSLDRIHAESVRKVFAKAPRGKPKRRIASGASPQKNDLEDLGYDVYEKYFKVAD